MRANAATTPEIRAYIKASDKSVGELAKELCVSRTTIRRWRGRATADDDASYTPKRRTSSLSDAEERLVCELRRRASLSIDDITDVMRRYINAQVSRSAIHKSLQRNGLDRVRCAGDVTAGGLDQIDAGLEHPPASPHPRGLRPVQPDRDTVTAGEAMTLKLVLDVRSIDGAPVVVVGAADPQSAATSVESLQQRLAADRRVEPVSDQPEEDCARERLASQADHGGQVSRGLSQPGD